jgi:hypothetical protein
MTQMPYVPMRDAEKAVTQEDMWKTLAKHAPVEVRVQLSKTEAQTPKAESAIALEPLLWNKPVWTGTHDNPYVCGYILSQCGRFSICKDSVHGKEMYMAWARREPPHASIILGVRPTRAEAEVLCHTRVRV